MPSLFPMEEPGFWALTRRADIQFVSQHPELFTSADGVALDPMPVLTIMDMLGVPTADQPPVAYAAEKLFSMGDDEYSSIEERAQDTINEIMLLSNTGVELAKFRRNNPGDDLMTSIVNAEVDGQRLTDEEIGAFLILLASAGNDTTKHGVGREPRPARLADGGLRKPNPSCRRGIRALGLP
jgi:hypothetical protein